MPAANTKPTRALLVDDSPLVVELLTRALQTTGAIEVVGAANNGRSAVRLTDSLRPDVVVMDVKMPVMDGITAVGEIMRTCPVPILVLSDSESAEISDLTFRALSHGAIDFRSKPRDDADRGVVATHGRHSRRGCRARLAP